MSSFLCSSPPFASSNLRTSTNPPLSPSSSPTKSSSRLTASQERRAARLQRPFADVSKSPTDGYVDVSGSSDGSSPLKYDPLRAKRRRDHGAALARRRQALFHAARGGDDEMIRFIWLSEKKRWELDLQRDADDMGLSIDELLALENEQLSNNEFGPADTIMRDRRRDPLTYTHIDDVISSDDEMVRMMEIEEQKELEDAERLYFTQQQNHSCKEVPDIPQDIAEWLMEDRDDGMAVDEP
ncbi:hypothetical protein V1525DRAFT_457580 [Lipomyces kononenkoae]|uniref:Uncharacterized protein n=1 Tax=Lipomyces kononenkoae TaxID=34357 RepID=A0ACC3SXY9_LIPKO